MHVIVFVRLSYPTITWESETVGRRDVLLLNKKQTLDLGILIAVDRCATGANSHCLRGLANAYVLAFENGQPRRAEEYRIRLLGELRRVRERTNHGFERHGKTA